MPRVHLVTGATGFVGRALVLELLARTQAPVVCLVRADGTSPQERLRNALFEAADAYDCPQSVRAAITQRCHAVAGDIRSPECGLARRAGLARGPGMAQCGFAALPSA